MTDAADNAISHNLLHGSPGMTKPPRNGEVGLVASIVLGAVPDISRAWTPVLAGSGYALRMSGVFCHQAPMVRFKANRSAQTEETCELADLLVVVDSYCVAGATRFASLIQAKMASSAKRVKLMGPSSVRQLFLYQNWPTFEFSDGAYGTRRFNLRATCIEESGTFGIIDRHLKNSLSTPPVWTQHPASPTPTSVSIEPTLGRFLADMVGRTGLNCGRRAFEGGVDDWSQVVDLLMKVTYDKVFRHVPTLGNSIARRGITALMVSKMPPIGVIGFIDGGGSRPPIDGVDFFEADGPRAISVLRIIVAETSDGKE